MIAGFKAHADRGTAGIRVAGSSVPITITGFTSDVGVNGSSYYPAESVSIVSNSASVVVGASTLGAVTTPWSWDSSGVVARSGCVSATGEPGSQKFARLADI